MAQKAGEDDFLIRKFEETFGLYLTSCCYRKPVDSAAGPKALLRCRLVSVVRAFGGYLRAQTSLTGR